MKAILVPVACALALVGFALSPTEAEAKGCIKGAIVGGIAGHYAGHHGILGATGGCIVGRHMAKKNAQQERAYEQQQYSTSPAQPQPYGNSGSPYTGTNYR